MANEIISYLEMCQREGANLQKGMNFRLSGRHSVILMSQQKNAPYTDQIVDDGATLIYEGHDEPRRSDLPDPKQVDQPAVTKLGTLTDNGKFHQAAQEHKEHGTVPEPVRVYEKIKQGIWSYNGLFHLVDSWVEFNGQRQVFKFKLIAVGDSSTSTEVNIISGDHPRIIPTTVKLEVWKRDKGQCVLCGSTVDLHFDHIIPYAKGGTSLKAENIQLLCAHHNLQKSDSII